MKKTLVSRIVAAGTAIAIGVSFTGCTAQEKQFWGNLVGAAIGGAAAGAAGAAIGGPGPGFLHGPRPLGPRRTGSVEEKYAPSRGGAYQPGSVYR